MSKHIIWFFSALLFLAACKQDNNGIINEDEMVQLLAGVHIIDGSLTSQIAGDSLYKYGTGRYLYLFKQYHTDEAQFKQSVKYYTTQPEVLASMYDEVNTILQAKADSLNKELTIEADRKRKELEKAQKKADALLKQKEKLQQDSINKARLVTPKASSTGRPVKTKVIKKNRNKDALP